MYIQQKSVSPNFKLEFNKKETLPQVPHGQRSATVSPSFIFEGMASNADTSFKGVSHPSIGRLVHAVGLALLMPATIVASPAGSTHVAQGKKQNRKNIVYGC